MTIKNLEKYIDHTLLKPQATEKDIIELSKIAKQNDFAAVCVNPCWVETVAQELADTAIKVCTVIGFPLGANLTALKVYEAEEALMAGAQEIDVVINIGRVKMQDEKYVLDELSEMSQICKKYDAILKVILETCLLTDQEKIFSAQLAVEAGADFVKTSTGFSTGGATLEDVALLRKTVGDGVGVKASGGIRTLSDAKKMIEAGASRLGTSNGENILLEYLGG